MTREEGERFFASLPPEQQRKAKDAHDEYYRALKLPLKPCPFCGSTKPELCWILNFGESMNGSPFMFAVHCHECGATGDSQPNPSQSVTAWNRRAK